jgi:hypothetical protein
VPGLAARLPGRDGRTCRFGGLAGEPQRFQLRHVVGHGLQSRVALGLAVFGFVRLVCGLVGTGIGAVAIFFCHLNCFLLLGLGFGFCRLVAVGGFFGQSNRTQVGCSLSYRDIGGRDIGHGLDAFGILGELSVQPNLFHFGGGFRFVIHRVPQN